MLRNGDLLFRYLDRYDVGGDGWDWEKFGWHIYEEIAGVQALNNVWDDVDADWAGHVDYCVFHVGIYHNAKGVLEILGGGLETHKIDERDNFDIVVRFPKFGEAIAAQAWDAHTHNPSGGIQYPLIREGIVENYTRWKWGGKTTSRGT